MDNPGISKENAKFEKKGLFTITSKKKQAPFGIEMPDMTGQISTMARRLVTLEERYTNLDRKLQVIDKNMLTEDKRLREELRMINSDILEIKKDLNESREKISLIIDEIGSLASKEEFEVLKKYIEYWEPLNFVTRNEVEKLINEKLRKSK